MTEGYGYGKVILFGEHFVVYGLPAIAGGISKKTLAKVEEGTKPGIEIIDNRLTAKGYKEKYVEQQKESMERMKPLLGVDFEKNPVKITLSGDLYCASGVGASAASCVATARAISNYFQLELTNKQINACGLEGDKAYAGNPSGVDNTVSTYGSLVYFKKPNHMEQIQLKNPLHIVLGSTGVTTKTSEAVAGVKQRKEENQEEYSKLFNEAEILVNEARKTLEAGELEKIGEYMNKNHELLQKIGVSCKELDYLVTLARENGALGAKMTGGGLGGYMVCLAPNTETQNKISQAMEKQGFKTIVAQIE